MNDKPTYQELEERIAKMEAEYKEMLWLREKIQVQQIEPYIPFYGDVAEFNTERTILDLVGKENLRSLTSELMDLLETSVAVYEKNGDYAFGMFNSNWCQFMDYSSRKLCETEDNYIALNSGKWLCHDDCWKISNSSIVTKKTADLDCVGGIKIYAEPIFVNDEVIGVINFGYGNPPTDIKSLQELSKKYCIDIELLKENSKKYNPRPDFIIEIAKKRIKSIAKLIGEIIDRKLAELSLQQTNVELKIAKERAIESEERFILAMKASNDGIFDWNLETNEIYYSPGWKKMLGYEDHELSNDFLIWEKTTDPEDVKESWALQQKLITKQIDRFVLEIKMKHKDGHWVDILARAEAIFNDNGKAVRIIGIHTDITERKQTVILLQEKSDEIEAQNEEYLQINEELSQTNEELIQAKERIEETKIRLELAIDAGEHGFWDWNLITNSTYFSPSYYTMLGYADKELPMNLDTFMQLIHSADSMIVMPIVQQSIETGKPYEVEFRLMCKDGSYKWILGKGKSYYNDESGKPYRAVGVHIDIHDRKKAEEELKIAKEKAEESELTFRKLFEESADGNLLIDSSGVFVECNQAALNLLQMPREQFLFMPPVKISPEYQPNGRKSEEAAIEMIDLAYKNGLNRFDWTCINAKGEEFIVEVSLMPIWVKGQTMLHTTWRNITKRKQDEIELQKAKEKAEESDRLKTAFLQNMSHEIRTPMNAIIGFSDFLANPDLSLEKRKSFVSIIQNSSNQLLSIISDILSISSIETNQTKACIEEVCINNIIVDLLAIYKGQALTHNISLYAKQQLTDNQSVIYTDKTKITQVLTNLITNALKFTHEGFVEFGYTVVDTLQATTTETLCADPEMLGATKETLRATSLRFYVKDSGIGIRSEMHEKIFERFRQANENVSKQYGGTGLGLAISKAFVELMGGKIWVKSEPVKGSTFYFTIPYKPVYEIDKTNSNTAQTENRITIVIAEDEEYNFLYLEELLKSENINIIHTKDGKETVDLCKSNPDIALVLMDIKMPILNGHEAAKQIKEFRPELVIIAQTAYAMEHEREKYSGTAFNEYITKPIYKDKLKQLLTKYIDK